MISEAVQKQIHVGFELWKKNLLRFCEALVSIDCLLVF